MESFGNCPAFCHQMRRYTVFWRQNTGSVLPQGSTNLVCLLAILVSWGQEYLLRNVAFTEQVFLPCWWLNNVARALRVRLWFDLIQFSGYLFFLHLGCHWGVTLPWECQIPRDTHVTIVFGLNVTCRHESTLFRFPGTLQAMTLQSTLCWSMSTTAGKPPTPFTSPWTRASRTAAWASRPMSGTSVLGHKGIKGCVGHTMSGWHPPPPKAGLILQYIAHCLLRKLIPHS